MKLLRYLGLLGLSLFVACVKPPEPPKSPLVVSLKASPTEVIVGGLTVLQATVTPSSDVAEVEFFDGISSLGKDSSSPFEMVVSGFTEVGVPKAFKAVATDNNGLKAEGLTAVAVVAVKPTNFQLTFGDFLTEDKGLEVIFSSEQIELKATYEAGTVSNRTKWTLQPRPADPAPTGDSLGTIVAIPGDPDGLLSSKVRFVPPQIADFGTTVFTVLEAQSVQDPTQKRTVLVATRKKGTQDGIAIVMEGSSNNQQRPLGVPATSVIDTINDFGSVDNTAVWQLSDPTFGTLTCPSNSGGSCRFNTRGEIVGRQVVFTPTKLGKVRLIADSQHDGRSDSIEVTVVP
ncbi:MAG: hypothetical protein RLZZ156_1447 [Deinococcota bacterium]|jgi:hypothetical protein